jgi:hypothetical protein
MKLCLCFLFFFFRRFLPRSAFSSPPDHRSSRPARAPPSSAPCRASPSSCSSWVAQPTARRRTEVGAGPPRMRPGLVLPPNPPQPTASALDQLCWRRRPSPAPPLPAVAQKGAERSCAEGSGGGLAWRGG